MVSVSQSSRKDRGSEEEFVAEGHELARLLSEELGWQVAYSE
jgi:hypothetical protein